MCCPDGTQLLSDKTGKVLSTRLSGAMDSASDFGSEGCGFESHLGRFFLPEHTILQSNKSLACGLIFSTLMDWEVNQFKLSS